jgi:hypothetical protein
VSTVTTDREVDHWLDELRRQRWTMVYLPNREDPQVVTAVLRWPDCVDVVALFSDADALAFRAPADPRDDPFRPTSTTWVYAGVPVWTIRAALALPEPGTPGEPRFEQAPPPLVRGLAELAGRNRVVRPPST